MSRAYSRLKTSRPRPEDLIVLFNQLVDKQASLKLQKLRIDALDTLYLCLVHNPIDIIQARQNKLTADISLFLNTEATPRIREEYRSTNALAMDYAIAVQIEEIKRLYYDIEDRLLNTQKKPPRHEADKAQCSQQIDRYLNDYSKKKSIISNYAGIRRRLVSVKAACASSPPLNPNFITPQLNRAKPALQSSTVSPIPTIPSPGDSPQTPSHRELAATRSALRRSLSRVRSALISSPHDMTSAAHTADDASSADDSSQQLVSPMLAPGPLFTPLVATLTTSTSTPLGTPFYRQSFEHMSADQCIASDHSVTRTPIYTQELNTTDEVHELSSALSAMPAAFARRSHAQPHQFSVWHDPANETPIGPQSHSRQQFTPFSETITKAATASGSRRCATQPLRPKTLPRPKSVVRAAHSCALRHRKERRQENAANFAATAQKLVL
jgi:hypothetical protein